MNHIVSNEEFVFLTENRSPKLKQMAKVRHASDPKGSLDEASLDNITFACQASGCNTDSEWLKSLKQAAKNGSISRIKTGNVTWHEHVAEVNRLVAQKKVPFGLKDMVVIKETGRRGTVSDYNTETGEYIVLMTPFQVVCLKPEDLVSTWDKSLFTEVPDMFTQPEK